MKDEATPEMIEMARRIAAKFVTCPAFVLEGNADDWPEVKSALVAIIETQRLDAELAENNNGYSDVTGDTIAHLIRAGHHYGKAAQ